MPQYWIAGTAGDWSTAADWQSGVVPNSTDDAVINNSSSVTLTGMGTADSLALDNSTLTLSGTLTLGTSLTLDYGTLALSGGTLSVQSIASDSGTNGHLVGYGSVNVSSAVSGDVVIDAQGGSLKVEGSLAGDQGSLVIDTGAILELSSGAAMTVFCDGSSATLKLDTPAAFTGAITEFGVGDTIDLGGITASSASYSNGTLTINETNGQQLTYNVNGTLAGDIVTVASDNNGGTDIYWSTPPDSYSWIAGTAGDWSTAADWQSGVVPNSTDDAVINNSSSVTLTGMGTADSLALDNSTLTLSGTLTLGTSLTLDYGTLALSGGTLSVQSIASDSGTNGHLVGYGSVNVSSAVSGDVVIDAQGGSLKVEGSLAGDQGSLVIDTGAILELSSGAAMTVFCDGSSATLKLDTPAAFTGAITEFGVGDTIDLGGITASSASYSNGTLTINETNGQQLTYNVNGTLAGDIVTVASDNNGGTDIYWSTPPDSWIAGTAGDWSTAADWQSGVVPNSTDDAVINNSSSVTLTGMGTADSLALDNSTLTLSGTLTLGTSLTLDYGTLALSGGTLSVQSIASDSGTNGHLVGYGSVNVSSAVSGDVVIDAQGGSLKVEGSLAGDQGSLVIDTGAILELSSGAAMTVFCDGSSATLKLDTPAAFTGAITEFGVGDTIDLGGITASSASYSNGTLTINETNGQQLTYNVNGTLAGDTLTTASDNNGGTLVYWATATAPTQTLGGPYSGNENTTIALTGLSVSASPNTGDPLSTVLSVADGTITVDGQTGASVTLTGTAAKIDAELTAGVSYAPNANFYGSDALNLTTTDTADGLKATGSASISVAGTTAPTQTLGGPYSGNENTTIALTGLSVSASPNTGDPLSTVLSVADGTITVDGQTGASVTLTGTAAKIDAELTAGVSYAPNANFYGSDALNLTTTDTADGLKATGSASISVAGTTAPTQTLGGPYSGNENTTIALTGLSVSASPNTGDPLSTVLSVADGTITVDGQTGASVTLTGTAAKIDAELTAGVSYAPNANFYGSDALNLTTTDTADGLKATGSASISVKQQTIVTPPSVTCAYVVPPNAKVGHWVVSGSAQPGATITVDDGGTELGTTKANGKGSWTFTTTENDKTIRDFAATATVSGNTSAFSAAWFEGTPGNDTFVFTATPTQTVEQALAAPALIDGGAGWNTILLNSSSPTAMVTLTDADFAHLEDIEELSLTGVADASSITLGKNAAADRLGNVDTGSANTSITDSNRGILKVNASELAPTASLTLSSNAGTEGFTVTGLTSNLTAAAVKGALTVTTGAGSLAIATGSGVNTINAGALAAGDTLTLTGSHAATVAALGGNLAANGDSGNLSVTLNQNREAPRAQNVALGGGDDTVHSGYGADNITVASHLESDVFVYTAVNASINGGAHDTITGFLAGGAVNDVIDFFSINPKLHVEGALTGGAKVAADSIAWVYSGTNAFVYVDDTSSALSTSSGSLMEITLAGMQHGLSASNFKA